MGHNRLGNLPHTHRWKEVIALLENDAEISELTDASFYASLTALKRVPSDRGFLGVLNQIVELATVSREKDIAGALNQAGFNSEAQASSIGFLSVIATQLTDKINQTYPRSDVGKIARDAFLEALTKQVLSKTGTLFGGTENAKTLTVPFRGDRFKVLMHEFYAGFTSRYLSYYLSRELPHHVGSGKRFSNIDEHSEFNKQFDLYCRQTVRIVDEFTPGWIGKAIYKKEADSKAVGRYAYAAFKKLTEEFQRSGPEE